MSLAIDRKKTRRVYLFLLIKAKMELTNMQPIEFY